MACYVRKMHKDDIEQVIAIDREAFPTQWPPPNFRHELRNRLAHYYVVCDESRTVERPEAAPQPRGLSGLFSRLKRCFQKSEDEDAPLTDNHAVVGYVGFWAMMDEAHITAIAVREAMHRRGLGEALIIETINRARELGSSTVTLEVRVSNTGAQGLYLKYGFNEVGTRKGYYTDNREDAYIMTTDDINSVSFKERFSELKKAHGEKMKRRAGSAAGS